MSEFPALYTKNDLHHKSVSPKGDGSHASSFQVLQGHNPSFRPAGLPPPAWFIAVNPFCDAPENTELDINSCFKPHNQDAEAMRIRGVSLVDAQKALWFSAMKDADSHVECDNGGLYAIWELPNGDLVLGGFDNGGSCIASFLDEVNDTLGGEVILAGGASHYSPTGLVASEDPSQLREIEKNMATLSLLLFNLERGPVAQRRP